jgi:hypothetical protein
MSTLADRYVWGVLRNVPEGQRAELEPEIRALIADAVDARTAEASADATAEPSPEMVERAALTELGDPEVLAARYTNRSLVLIGPRFFLVWKRMLLTLLPIVVPLAAIVAMAARAVGGATIGEVIGSGVSAAFTVSVQLVFWFTLVFAIIERLDIDVNEGDTGWTPDRLPALPAAGRPNVAELALSVAGLLFAGVFIVWQQVAAPIVIDGQSYPVFDPALWSFWLPWFLVVIVLELVFTGAVATVDALGRWTWARAVVNAVLAAAFAIPAVWLLQTDQLFNPAAVEALGPAALDAVTGPISTILAVSIAVIAGWDAVDGFRRAYLAERSAS